MGLCIACGFLDTVAELRTCNRYQGAHKPDTFTLCFFAEKVCQPLLRLIAVPADVELGAGAVRMRTRYLSEIQIVLGRRKGAEAVLCRKSRVFTTLEQVPDFSETPYRYLWMSAKAGIFGER